MGTLTAFALIIVRNLSRTENRGAIAFYFVIFDDRRHRDRAIWLGND